MSVFSTYENFEQFTITSIDNLLETVKHLKSKYNDQPIWFRGHSNKSWEPIPSIFRSVVYEKENYISNDFYIYVKQIEMNSPPKENYAAWIALMQHYGLPTRILDWSQSPLIATYFAVNDYSEPSDACLWVLLPRKLNIVGGFGNFVYPLDSYTAQMMLVKAFKKRAEIDKKFEDKILACHSVENNLRMYSQQSVFTVHNSTQKLTSLCDKDTMFKLIIPQEYKKKFYKDLDILGITSKYIYPDMEHISKDIIRKYSTEMIGEGTCPMHCT